MKLYDIELPSNRNFGFFFTAIFILIGIYFYLNADLIFTYLILTIAAIFFLTTIISPDLLLPLNKAWMWFGFLLGKVISPIILGIIFFIIITPYALVMRIFGRDELRLKFKERLSHWKGRNIDAAKTDTFKHQF